MSVPAVMTVATAPPGPKTGPTSPAAPAPVVFRPGKRRWYPPALLALGLTAWLAGHGAVVLERTGDLGRAIDSSRHRLDRTHHPRLPSLAVLAAERLWPAVRRPFLARGHIQDVLYLVLYAGAVVPLVVLIGVGFSDTLRHAAPWLVLPPTPFLPSWAAIGIGIVAMDGCNWLAHWANHRFTAAAGGFTLSTIPRRR